MVGALFAVMLAAAVDQPVGAGVSDALARERAEHIRNVRYELAFTIPEDRHTPVTGRVTVKLYKGSAHVIGRESHCEVLFSGHAWGSMV